jgi:hypothetical protein
MWCRCPPHDAEHRLLVKVGRVGLHEQQLVQQAQSAAKNSITEARVSSGKAGEHRDGTWPGSEDRASHCRTPPKGHKHEDAQQ